MIVHVQSRIQPLPVSNEIPLTPAWDRHGYPPAAQTYSTAAVEAYGRESSPVDSKSSSGRHATLDRIEEKISMSRVHILYMLITKYCLLIICYLHVGVDHIIFGAKYV